MVGHFTDADVVLEFLAERDALRARRARHVVPRPLPPHQGQAAGRRPALDAPVEECVARLAELHEAYRDDYAAYYERHATADSPAMRGADPAIVLVPGVGMFSYGKDKQTARVAGEFYVNAINVMRGAEAVSTYAPIAEREKFRIEYWALEEAKLQRHAQAAIARRAHRPRHRRGQRHRQGDRHPARRRGRLRGHRRPRPRQGAGRRGRDRQHRRRRRRRRPTSPTPPRCRPRSTRRCSRSAASTWS